MSRTHRHKGQPHMSTELATRTNGTATRTNFALGIVDAKISYAHQLATAGLLPREYQNNPGNLLLAVEWADALGVPAMTAIAGLHIMNGKPTASVSLMSSLVRRAGHKLRVTCDGNRATAQLIRADDPDFTFEVTWTMDMARAAGLMSNPTWKKYPDAMLKARAITQVCRDGAPDAINGVLYTPEEMGAMVELDEAGEQYVVHQATNVQARPPAPQEPESVTYAAIQHRVKVEAFAGDLEQTKAWWVTEGLPVGQPDTLVPIAEANGLVEKAKASLTDEVIEGVLVEDEPAAPAPANTQMAEDAARLFGTDAA